MYAPHPLVRAAYALLGYSSAHWAAGRYRRALMWDALLVAAMALVFWLPVVWILPALIIAQAIDAALIEPARERLSGGYAVASLIAGVVAVLVAMTVRKTYAEAFKIPSGAMIPTLQVGDDIWVKKFQRTPARGDVIVFKYPKEPDKDFIKRVVAVGGDTIAVRDNQLVINGKPVPRAHVDEPCEYDDFMEEVGRWEKRSCEAWDETLDGRTYRVIYDRSEPVRSWPAVTVPAGHTFVMGDNRDNSHDSRFWGTVPPDHVKGTAYDIWWSSGPAGMRWDRHGKRIR
jgi:signal peptidase I